MTEDHALTVFTETSHMQIRWGMQLKLTELQVVCIERRADSSLIERMRVELEFRALSKIHGCNIEKVIGEAM